MKNKLKIDQLKIKSFVLQDVNKKKVLSGGTRSHVDNPSPICVPNGV